MFRFDVKYWNAPELLKHPILQCTKLVGFELQLPCRQRALCGLCAWASCKHVPYLRWVRLRSCYLIASVQTGMWFGFITYHHHHRNHDQSLIHNYSCRYCFGTTFLTGWWKKVALKKNVSSGSYLLVLYVTWIPLAPVHSHVYSSQLILGCTLLILLGRPSMMRWQGTAQSVKSLMFKALGWIWFILNIFLW